MNSNKNKQAKELPVESSIAIEPDKIGSNIIEYTVSELSKIIRQKVEDILVSVRVRGELGRVSRPASGHVYFDVKDEHATLACVLWRNKATGQHVELSEGLEVIVTGSLTTFSGQSRYQLIVDKIAVAGEGALMALLEARRKKLAAEGIFADERKKPLPFFPRSIGVITSQSGAVIRDILHRLDDRMPTHLLLWPAVMQGEKCALEVAQAIDGFNALASDSASAIKTPEVIIIARGGGSIDDLWPFNDEQIVRAASRSRIAIISAIGHETDWCLLDHVADVRAPTPSAAAELSVPEKNNLLLKVHQAQLRLASNLSRNIKFLRQKWLSADRAIAYQKRVFEDHRQKLDSLSPRLAKALDIFIKTSGLKLQKICQSLSGRNLHQLLRYHRLGLDSICKKLPPAMKKSMQELEIKLKNQTRMLRNLGYRSVLERGFTLIVRDADIKSEIVTRGTQLEKNDEVKIIFHDDTEAAARITDDVYKKTK